MSKVKHSKFKNTGVLFELLVRQITNDAINAVDDSPAANIVKKFFSGPSMLKKELNYYQMLKTEAMTTEAKANKFVDIGSQIKSGQTLLIIEAMKTMNPIESSLQGKVLRILVENEQAVEFGQPLMLIG